VPPPMATTLKGRSPNPFFHAAVFSNATQILHHPLMLAALVVPVARHSEGSEESLYFAFAWSELRTNNWNRKTVKPRS
jgi:hypothetical protein